MMCYYVEDCPKVLYQEDKAPRIYIIAPNEDVLEAIAEMMVVSVKHCRRHPTPLDIPYWTPGVYVETMSTSGEHIPGLYSVYTIKDNNLDRCGEYDWMSEGM